MLLFTKLIVLSVLAVGFSTGQCPSSQRRSTLRGSFPDNPELQMNSSEIIRSRGYPVEVHSVATSDGYVLRLHRIPSRLGEQRRQTRPVFLHYGYMGTDAIWSIPPANRSLAYILADRGYDVWLGNSRGNAYSRQHLWLDPEQPEFWNFSWDEMGRYDTPASINYILKLTQQKRLVYIGNSFATTLFFIAAATNPELNRKIETMIALAPVAAATKTKSPMLKYVMLPALSQAKVTLSRRRRLNPFIDSGTNYRDPLRMIQRLVCERDYVGAAFCREMLFSITGTNRDNFDLNVIPGINTYIPAGISFNSLAQFGQQPPSGEYLAAFDYGPEENLVRYGATQPPVYNLKAVTAPVHIFYGQNDLLTPPEDIDTLTRQLGNVQSVTKVPDPCFNHFDFLFGVNVNQVLHPQVLSLIPPP